MSFRFTRVLVLSIVASGCGRVGYDQIAEVNASGTPANGGGSSTVDGGSGATDGAPPGNGGTVGGGGASGSAGTTGSGGLSGNGGVPGNGGAVGGGGTASNGGTPGNGGAIGPDATVGSGGVIGSGGTGGGGGTDGGGAPGSGGYVGDAGVTGCADGQREGFLDEATYPNIAACDGGFQVPGIVGLTGPACGRAAGDDGARPDGAGCNVEDLCAVGFHVCATPAEVAAKSSTGCNSAVATSASVFYLTLQSGGGQQKCGPGTNDLFGCGNIGFRAGTGCPPLERASGDLCSALVTPWSCGSDLVAEALNVTKPSSAAGGVLCCVD